MATKKLSEGVGKKIVEALKKQSEIEITPISATENQDEFESLNDELSQAFDNEIEESEDIFEETDFLEELQEESLDTELTEETPQVMEQHSFNSEEIATPPTMNPTFINYQQPTNTIQDNFIQDLDSFEIPSNIAVLKKLIAQLPSGVTRHTGAQIIKQTMEALGISMKSVLQEAQQVQEGLNNSAKECHSTIAEYKKQILSLEKQAQNHQKQYSALNELISLFIQTGV